MSHVSFSELKIWNECSYKHKLVYKDRLKGFVGNLYTAFGSAIHNTIEKFLLNEVSEEQQYDLFKSNFDEEMSSLNEQHESVIYDTFTNQGSQILDNYYTELSNYFGDFEVVSCEEQIFEDISDFSRLFNLNYIQFQS